jgi:hypothetical protein
VNGCRCQSYNLDIGQVPEVVVPLPDFQFRASRRQNRLVSLDACIADTIIELWNFGVLTLGCCCGHGQPRLGGPSIVLHGIETPRRVARLLELMDGRSWVLWQWRGDVLRRVL